MADSWRIHGEKRKKSSANHYWEEGTGAGGNSDSSPPTVFSRAFCLVSASQTLHKRQFPQKITEVSPSSCFDDMTIILCLQKQQIVYRYIPVWVNPINSMLTFLLGKHTHGRR
jgi:hypothetical protein